MVFVVAAFLTVTGVSLTYVATGLVRTAEKKRGYIDCEKRLEMLRRQIRARRANT